MAAQAVAGGNKMDNEKLGAFTRRVDDIKRQINDGSLSFVLAMRDLQKIVERKPLMVFDPWHTQVLMGRYDTETYLKMLLMKGYYIDKDTWSVLKGYQHLPMPYLADFARVTRNGLGLDNTFISYRQLRERVYEIAEYDPKRVPLPQLEAGLMLACDMNPDEIKYGEEIVVVTEPYRYGGSFSTDWVLVFCRETQGPRIVLRNVSRIEEGINSVDGSHIEFALMSRPYHGK